MDTNTVCTSCNGSGLVQIFVAGATTAQFGKCECQMPREMRIRVGMTFPEYEISRPKSSYSLLKAEVD